ncbi:MAG: hypothetical protein ABI559_11385 [Chloroflexota bacterium]
MSAKTTDSAATSGMTMAGRVDLVSSIVVGVFGVFTFAFGVWALVAPVSFFENIAFFGQYNRHFLHDLGAFQMGLGAALLFAVAWRNDALLAVLGGAAVGACAHEYAHIKDYSLGGRDSDPWTLGIIAAVLTATFVWRLRWRFRVARGER